MHFSGGEVIPAADYYEVLGLHRGVSDKDIRQAFRKLARQHHPDLNPGDKAAEARFKEIAEAYEVLSDPDSRARYDRLGAAWRTADSPFQTRTRTYGAVPDLEDIFGGPGADLGGIFSHLFHRGGVSSAAPERAALEHPVTVSLEEAYAGTSRLLTLASAGGPARRLEVRIPAGVRDGSRVHVAPDTTANGHEDIYLVVTIQPHAAFQRDGDDLTVKVPVPLTTTVLGGEVQVPTLKGSRLALRIPEQTQNGRKLRLRGQGMPKLAGDGHGDLYAEVSVVVPTHLSEEERKLFERLHELRTPK